MIRRGLSLVLAIAWLVAANPAFAQPVMKACDWKSEMVNIPEPWEEASRTYAKGAIRIVKIDTDGGPVCCPEHIVILAPNADDPLGGRQCQLVSDGPSGLGFMSIGIQHTRADYNPARGLTLRIPFMRYDPDTGLTDPGRSGMVRVLINQEKGTVTLQ